MEARSAQDYQKLLQSLLPKGKLWNRDPNSRIGQLLLGMADEFAAVDARALVLYEQSFVQKTIELLTDFEAEYALPELGSALGQTTLERQEDLYSKKLEVGQQSKQYFIDLANALNREITIEEFRPFWAGYGAAGDSCGPQRNIFFWKVWVEITVFTDVRISTLMSRFFRLKPAHTHLLFDFSGKAFDRSWSRDFDSVNFYDGSQYPGSFSSEFSNDFHNNVYYDGKNYIGAFSNAFSIAFDSYRGGDFSDAFNKNEFSTPT